MIPTLYEPFRHWSEKGSVYILSDLHFDDADCKFMSPDWITPQEQIGSGTPIDTARIMLLIPPESPRKRITKSRGRQTAIIPAMRKPMMSQGAIIANTFQNVLRKSRIISIFHFSVIVKGLSLAGCVLLQTILLMRDNYII